MRRNQLVACFGFMIVLTLAASGWQSGTLSGLADGGSTKGSGERAPAAPRLSSDELAWTDGADDDGDGRRSTASFASDRAFVEAVDEPTSGAKLFVADDRKSSNGTITRPPADDSTDETNRDRSGITGTGATGSATTATATGSGTTSTAESTTTSRSSTTASTTTTAKPTSTASTATSTTSTTTSTTFPVTSTTSTTVSTTTTRPSTTTVSTTTTTVSTTTPSTPTTVSTTIEPPPTDPLGRAMAGPT